MEIAIKDLGEIITGNTPSKKEESFWNSEDICFVKPDGIANGSITLIKDSNEYLSENARKKARVVSKDAVFVTCIGSIGKIGIASEGDYAFNQQINVVIPNEKVLPKYLAYNLLFSKERLEAIANAPVVPIINKTQFGEFTISIEESIEKQGQIIRILDELSGIINSRKEELDKLDSLIKARFVEMFGESNCETKKLSEITDIITKGTTPTTAGFEFTNDGVNFFKIESITEDHTINLNKVAYVSDECHATLKRSQLRAGDVLFSIAGAIGRTAIIGPDDLPGNTNQALAIIRLSDNSGISQKYLISALDSPEVFEQCRTKKRGVAQINLSLQDVGNIEIPIPNLDDQKAFESFTKQVDKSKFAVQKSLEKTQLLFDSLMQEYF